MTELILSNAEYHAHPAWSSSPVRLLPEYPELFHGRYITGEFPHPESDAIDLGTAVHSDLLEGGKGWLEIPADALTSNGQRRGKAWEAFEAEHAGQTLLLPSQAAKVRLISASVLADPMARRLLEATGKAEESLFLPDPETALPLKARPDKQCCFPDGLILADIKTVSDPGEYAFAYKCLDYGYARQAAWYSMAVQTCHLEPVEAFVFICVRSEPPYECRCWELTDRAIERGTELNRVAINDLATRLVSDDWHGPGFGRCLPLELPNRFYQE